MPDPPEHLLSTVYDEGAAAYETYWAPVLHRHARDLVAAVPPHPTGAGRVVADVATGTGTLLPLLDRVAGPGGRVLALDRSPGMLRRVPSPAARVQADAEALPLRDDSCDVLVLAFVLFMLPDARRAVREAARVLRPGGWLLGATWGAQTGSAADAVIREELDVAGAPAFPEVQRSDALTDSPERMARLLCDRFDEVATDSRPLGARFDPQATLALRTGASALGWRFSRLDEAGRAAVRDRARARLGALPAEAFVDRSEVLLTTARRR